MKAKEFMNDLKTFMKYIVLKPFMEFGNMMWVMYKGVGNLDRPYFWVRFFGMATVFLIIVALTTGHWIPSYVAAGVMFIALLRFEWISGRFRKWHTEQIKKRAKRINEEGKQNG